MKLSIMYRFKLNTMKNTMPLVRFPEVSSSASLDLRIRKYWSAALIDRPMRPLFDKAFGREIQVVPTVVSSDMVNTPDIIAIIASSAAVVISDIPFGGPIAAVRIAFVNGAYIVNPTFQQIEESELDIIVAGTEGGITMVEGGAKQVSEETMLKAIETAQPVITDLCKAQVELARLAGKVKLPVMRKRRPLFPFPIRESLIPCTKC